MLDRLLGFSPPASLSQLQNEDSVKGDFPFPTRKHRIGTSQWDFPIVLHGLLFLWKFEIGKREHKVNNKAR